MPDKLTLIVVLLLLLDIVLHLIYTRNSVSILIINSNEHTVLANRLLLLVMSFGLMELNQRRRFIIIRSLIPYLRRVYYLFAYI